MVAALLAILLASFVFMFLLMRMLRPARGSTRRSNPIEDLDSLDAMLQTGRLTPEQHATLKDRFIQRRGQAGLRVDPRGFDVLPPPPAPDATKNPGENSR